MAKDNKFFIDYDGKVDDSATQSPRVRGTGLGASDRVGVFVDPDMKSDLFYATVNQSYPFVNDLVYAIYGVLIGALSPFFPQSYEAAPSVYVLVYASKSNIPGSISHVRYPIRVRWDIWEFIAVPLMISEDLDPKNPINVLDINRNITRYFKKIHYYVFTSLVDRGFIPSIS